MNKTIEKLLAVVVKNSQPDKPGEGKDMTYFNFLGWNDPVKGMALDISKKSLRDFVEVFKGMDDPSVKLAEIVSKDSLPKYKTIVTTAEKRLGVGASIWIAQAQEKMKTEDPEFPEEFMRDFICFASETLDTLDASASTADPDRAIKNDTCGAFKYQDLLVLADSEKDAYGNFPKNDKGEEILPAHYAMLYKKYDNEMAQIQAKRDKVSQVSLADIKEYAIAKFTANGMDDDGFVRLKGKSEKTADNVTPATTSTEQQTLETAKVG